MKKNIILLCITALFILSCNKKKNTKETTVLNDNVTIEKPLSKGDSIVNSAIMAHGGKLFDKADFSFNFREKIYRFENDGTQYSYSSESQKGDSLVKDIMTSGKFDRTINNKLQTLSKEEADRYSEALNSVIYFATLPYKLQDASVHKKYIEQKTIKSKKYDVIQVTFGQEGGGKDFDDEYMYWINKNTHKIDYLAYNYHVNEGGVRFRAAFNTRVIDGITFQDYINYEAPVGTDLKDLSSLYEQEKLKKLSNILTENVVNNHK
ncbi:DUF6503 family protein [Flavobacterium sp. 7A]|uniref:DUF6503 family protein n=1 Tax=Flavobacterium sp. 7A TaxID=2940571 RepID=UPI0022271417|nr:DUF6503 family protein [Flavobacterium sp. 7A]MCW2119297.1 hypothetical protein [Flavobacterium sp. 7A]